MWLLLVLVVACNKKPIISCESYTVRSQDRTQIVTSAFEFSPFGLTLVPELARLETIVVVPLVAGHVALEALALPWVERRHQRGLVPLVALA